MHGHRAREVSGRRALPPVRAAASIAVLGAAALGAAALGAAALGAAALVLAAMPAAALGAAALGAAVPGPGPSATGPSATGHAPLLLPALPAGVQGPVLAGSLGRRPQGLARLGLRERATVALPGPTDRFDYAADDPAAHLLFVADMAAGTVVEVDTTARRVVRVIPDVAEATGVIVVPALHRVFASAPGTGQVVTIDEGTGAVLARTLAGSFPDGLAYVPSTGQVWVSDETGGAETVIDASSGQAVARVALGGQAGNVAYDATTGRVLVDVQTRDQLVVIDPRTRRIDRRVRVPGCVHDHGLAVTPARAFVACDGNAVLVELRVPGLVASGSVRVGATPDVVAADTPRHVLYVAAESGVVTVIDTAAARARVRARAWVGTDAHVVAVDPSTGDVYFPLARAGRATPELLVAAPAGRNRRSGGTDRPGSAHRRTGVHRSPGRAAIAVSETCPLRDARSSPACGARRRGRRCASATPSCPP